MRFLDLIPVCVILAAILSLAILGFGCGPKAPLAFPYEAGQTFQATAASLNDQALWTKILARLSANVNNPGLRTAAGMEWFAEVKIIGTDGSILLEGDGEGSGTLSPEARKVITELLDEETNSEVQQTLRYILQAWKDRPAATPTTQP